MKREPLSIYVVAGAFNKGAEVVVVASNLRMTGFDVARGPESVDVFFLDGASWARA